MRFAKGSTTIETTEIGRKPALMIKKRGTWRVVAKFRDAKDVYLFEKALATLTGQNVREQDVVASNR